MTTLRSVLASAFVLATAFTLASCDETVDEQGFNATGIYFGDYQSTAEGRDVSGEVTIDMHQEDGRLFGTAQMTNAPCLTSARFEGTIDEETFFFEVNLIDDDDPQKDFVFRGQIFPDTAFFDATYEVGNWGVCTGSYGVATATRID